MPRTFVMGDIHGAYRAFVQCLERSDFDADHDRLICLGDVCDGWPETRECIEKLLSLRYVTYVLGNHDLWLLEWMESGFTETNWVVQGGAASIRSYHTGVPESHIQFLENALPYYIENNRLFVHAGINLKRPITKQWLDTFLWDRGLADTVLKQHAKDPDHHEKLTSFDEIYIGHTPVPLQVPVHAYEVWMMDTGAGWSGVLSMIEIHTKEIFRSDPVPLLYPGIEGRKKFSDKD